MAYIRHENPHQPEAADRLEFLVWLFVLGGALALSIILWGGGSYLWTHPESKLGYALMKKIGKIEPIRRFQPYEAPQGKFYSPTEFLTTFLALSPAQLKLLNTNFLRSYIHNYVKQRDPVTYLYGRFTIIAVEKIPVGRFVSSGAVILAQSEEAPNLFIEYVLPASEEQTSIALGLLHPGIMVTLQKSNDLAAVLRISRQPDSRLIATVINLLYGDFVLDAQSGVSFSCDPPDRLEPETGWPVFPKQKELFANLKPSFQNNLPEGVAPVKRPDLAKQDSPKPFLPQSNTPLTVRPNRSKDALTPPTLTSESSSPGELISAAVAISTAPSPFTQEQSASSTEIPQDLASASAPANKVASWPLFASGEVPPAKLVGVEHLPSLVRSGLPSEPLHLAGEFLVSAVGPGSVVLRTKGPELQPFLPNISARSSENIRIVAEFPLGARLPQRGETIVRDSRRPFVIVGISSAPDGSTNVRVRELTVP